MKRVDVLDTICPSSLAVALLLPRSSDDLSTNAELSPTVESPTPHMYFWLCFQKCHFVSNNQFPQCNARQTICPETLIPRQHTVIFVLHFPCFLRSIPFFHCRKRSTFFHPLLFGISKNTDFLLQQTTCCRMYYWFLFLKLDDK